MLKFTRKYKGCYTATIQGVTFRVEALDEPCGKDNWAVRIDGDRDCDWVAYFVTKRECVESANRTATYCLARLIREFGV